MYLVKRLMHSLAEAKPGREENKSLMRGVSSLLTRVCQTTAYSLLYVRVLCTSIFMPRQMQLA